MYSSPRIKLSLTDYPNKNYKVLCSVTAIFSSNDRLMRYYRCVWHLSLKPFSLDYIITATCSAAQFKTVLFKG